MNDIQFDEFLEDINNEELDLIENIISPGLSYNNEIIKWKTTDELNIPHIECYSKDLIRTEIMITKFFRSFINNRTLKSLS